MYIYYPDLHRPGRSFHRSLVLLEDALKEKGAACLDGSPPGQVLLVSNSDTARCLDFDGSAAAWLFHLLSTSGMMLETSDTVQGWLKAPTKEKRNRTGQGGTVMYS